MRKFLLTILLSFMFLSQVQAADWHEVIKNEEVTWLLDMDNIREESNKYKKTGQSTSELWIKMTTTIPERSIILSVFEFDFQTKQYRITEFISYDQNGKNSGHKRYPDSKFVRIIPDSSLEYIYDLISPLIKENNTLPKTHNL